MTVVELILHLQAVVREDPRCGDAIVRVACHQEHDGEVGIFEVEGPSDLLCNSFNLDIEV